MDKIPQFKGRQIAPSPRIGYLSGSFGKKSKKIHDNIVKEKYNNNRNLRKSVFEDGVVKGSNTYDIFAFNEALEKLGAKTTTLPRVEIARESYEHNPEYGLNTEPYYVDFGLVWRSADGSNKDIARKLEPDIKKALGIKKIKHAVIITPEHAVLINDEEAEHGLGFKLAGKPIYDLHDVLKKDTCFSKIDENSIPIPDKNGNRHSYTRDFGLCGLFLHRQSDVGSSVEYLADSRFCGRVVAEENNLNL